MRKIPHGEFYCLSTGMDTIASQVTVALNAFELCLSQFNENFTKMQARFHGLNQQLDEANLSPCLIPTVNLLNKITKSIPGPLFLEKYKIVQQKYEEAKRKFESEYAEIKPQAKKARNSLKLTVSIFQRSVEPLKRAQDTTTHSTLPKSLISFYSRFETESATGRDLVTRFCTLATDTINKIKQYVRENLEPMMFKCSLNMPDELDDSLTMIDSLIQQMKKELNVSNVIQQFVITILPPVLKNQINPQQTHRMVNYFELENKLSNSGTARVIKDYTVEGKEPIYLKAGEVLEISSSGYSRYWKVQNSKKVSFYVPSDILQL